MSVRVKYKTTKQGENRKGIAEYFIWKRNKNQMTDPMQAKKREIQEATDLQSCIYTVK